MAEPDHTAPQRIAVGRTIGLVLAAAGIAVSAKCASDCIRLNAEFHRWAIARPMDIEADFSKPGEIAVPFQQTCSISHGESVCLQITPPLDELYEPAQLLDDLSGRIVIRDSTGREIERGVFGATTIRRRAAGETIVLTDFAPFATGDYVVTVSVDQGSPELKDRRQRLYAEYNLCGLEQLPALIAGAFSLGAGMIGFLTALCVIPGLTRHGFRVADPRASGDQAGAEF